MTASRTFLVFRALACGFAASVALAVAPIASEAAFGDTTTTVAVMSRPIWTETGLALAVGEQVDIRAVGRIHFGDPPIDQMAPAGIPRAGGCSGIQTTRQKWPAPELACWTLIARIGNGEPFPIGAAGTFRVPCAGVLFLGVNDNYLFDNSGAWSAEVTVTPVPGAAGSGGESSTLKKTAMAIAGLAALIGLFALVLLFARRRSAGRDEPEPTEPDGAELVRAGVLAGDISGDILPEPRVHAVAAAPIVATAPVPTPTVVAPKGGPSDVNIFEVEFPDLASLRVGYSYFPEGTTVRWLVRQGAGTAAAGQFITSGGGEANHYVTLALGTDVRLRPEAADVEFTWDIGGVPFGYSVRRDPES